ncbi:DUF4863 family protein [Trinickia dinghuensis]|uniref:DUF4863 family protein n=1 Tax=Trinickia dinghuensis TaxID=2291023 RepID=A0A3D8JYL5_9BURK|nr:DUF4863 family protein [Trinickia dinghuensis]RDU98138.1 DUF4863 family protein [Trinickia dinghuensis]
MSPDDFERLIAEATAQLSGRALDETLDRWLNETWPAGSTTYEALAEACRAGVAEGWLCNREAGGIRYGRIFKATPRTHDFSVDVVRMEDLAGPHHTHPNGEIDLIVPLSEHATFDGRTAGWCVYGPGSAHRPTVANGRALILYLLPQGAIEFTRQSAE